MKFDENWDISILFRFSMNSKFLLLFEYFVVFQKINVKFKFNILSKIDRSGHDNRSTDQLVQIMRQRRSKFIWMRRRSFYFEKIKEQSKEENSKNDTYRQIYYWLAQIHETQLLFFYLQESDSKSYFFNSVYHAKFDIY